MTSATLLSVLCIAAAASLGPTSAGAAPAPAAWSGPDGGWDFSGYDAASQRVYVARTDGVTVLDVPTGRATTLLQAGRAHAAIPVNGGREVLVTEGAAGRAVIADAHSGAVRARIPTGKKPDAALVDPATGLALVFDNAGGGVTLIDPAAGVAMGAIATPGALESAVADGTGKVFVNVEDLAVVTVLDVRARKVVAQYPLKGCESPSGLALDPATHLLVAACANHVAKVLRAADGGEVATLPIGGRPDWAGYDPLTGTVLIPTGEDGVVTVIAARAGGKAAVVGKVAGHTGSRSGAIDPGTGRLYLPSAEFVAPAGGGRPAATPGTFRILAVDPAL